MDRYELGLAIAGLVALLAAWLPPHLVRRPASLPLVLVVTGAIVAALPLGFPDPDPARHTDLVERLAEFGVIVSLMGAGLAIDRPFSWRTWSNTWRMLAVAMPLTIVATAVLGSTIAGLAAGSAVLLGAVIAPTDPVLASDVQVGEPSSEAVGEVLPEDEVRFTLTSEGGLNDALAFPFVYLALRATEAGQLEISWLLTWLAWDVAGRMIIGCLAGWVVGKVLGIVAFSPPGPLRALAEAPQGFVAVAATLLAYGSAELLHGYGFVAVFVAAVVLRSSKREHELHAELHRFAQQIEHLFVVAILLLFGGALVSGVLDELTWKGALVGAAVVFLVRPVVGWASLAGATLSRTERWTIAFFGIRGVGSIYYLAYALSAERFGHEDELWAIVAFTLATSIVVHGVAASGAMRRADRALLRRRRREHLA